VQFRDDRAAQDRLRDADSLDAVSASMCAAVGFGDADRILSIVPALPLLWLGAWFTGADLGGKHGAPLPGAGSGVIIPQLADGGITLFPSVPSATT